MTALQTPSVSLQHIKKSLNPCLDMVGQEEVVIAFQSEYRQVNGVPEDNITDAAVAEGLYVVDDPVNLPAAKLSFDILEALMNGVGVGVVGILLGE